MKLSTETGAIAYDTLEAMNNAIASLKDKCGVFYFDDICFEPLDFDYVAEATIVYSENEVNFYQPMRHFNFELTSAADTFMAALKVMLPDYTDEQVTALAARLKRQF